MKKCLLCLCEVAKLTREHIIPYALGKNIYLPEATCETCQQKCNKEFETRFTKGSNFIAVLRSYLGIRGRGKAPIFGLDGHGHPLQLGLREDFPPVRVGFYKGVPCYPAQVILLNEKKEPLNYFLFAAPPSTQVSASAFDDLVDTIPPSATIAALWADGDHCPVNVWHAAEAAFRAWCHSKHLMPVESTVSPALVQIPIQLDWNHDYMCRAFTKICFMYAMSRIDSLARYDAAFSHCREYILNGVVYPSTYWKHAPLLQWNGPQPGKDVITKPLTYLLATVNVNGSLFSLIWLAYIGLFGCKLTLPTPSPVCGDTVTTYTIERPDEDTVQLKEEVLSSDDRRAFAQSVTAAGQL